MYLINDQWPSAIQNYLSLSRRQDAEHIKMCHVQDLNLKQALLHFRVICFIVNEISLHFSLDVQFGKHTLVGHQS